MFLRGNGNTEGMGISLVLFTSFLILIACDSFVGAFQIGGNSYNYNYNYKYHGSRSRSSVLKAVNGDSKTKIKTNDAKSKKSKIEVKEVTTLQDLEDHFLDVHHLNRKQKSKSSIDYDKLINSISVKGDTQLIGSPSHPTTLHPVLRLLHERRRTSSPLTPTTSTRPDGHKVALVVEGGGMRGCVTAGMVTAIHYLGLEDTIDVIYGSSAGTVIGAYFNTRQLPFFGPEIYYDSLTTAGRRFIDGRRLLRSLGGGFVDPRLAKDVVLRRNNGKPVLNLDFLLRETLQVKKPLDWEKFVEMQKVQPLKVVASGLKQKRSFVLDMENGAFGSLEELSRCMHASCLLPGIAGPVMNVNFDKINLNTNGDSSTKSSSSSSSSGRKFVLRNNLKKEPNEPNMEPMADAIIYEPLPYRSAIDEGATHVLMLRSIPDGTDVTGKSSLFSSLIFKRFFLRKNKLKHAYEHMRRYMNKKVYAEQVIELNDKSKDVDRDYRDASSPHVMTVAIPPGSPEVSRLESRREEIFEGVRRGFARAYDALVEDPEERGRGYEVAKRCLPDEILDYDPLEIDAKGESAFDFFLEERRARGEGYDMPESLGKTALEAGLPR